MPNSKRKSSGRFITEYHRHPGSMDYRLLSNNNNNNYPTHHREYSISSALFWPMRRNHFRPRTHPRYRVIEAAIKNTARCYSLTSPSFYSAGAEQRGERQGRKGKQKDTSSSRRCLFIYLFLAVLPRRFSMGDTSYVQTGMPKYYASRSSCLPACLPSWPTASGRHRHARANDRDATRRDARAVPTCFLFFIFSSRRLLFSIVRLFETKHPDFDGIYLKFATLTSYKRAIQKCKINIHFLMFRSTIFSIILICVLFFFYISFLAHNITNRIVTRTLLLSTIY